VPANVGSLPRQPLSAGGLWTCRGSAVFWQRTAAFLIDLGLLGALHLAFFLVIAVFLIEAAPLDFGVLLGITITYVLLFLAGPFFLVLSYFTILHTWGGQTLGKVIIGIRVVGADDRPLPVGRAFLRTTAYFVSALPLGAGFLWIVLDSEDRSWHDLLAGSKVIITEDHGTCDHKNDGAGVAQYRIATRDGKHRDGRHA
jgi:uncharacterized RDD family membrane protein YckC